jgi:hypothetical protein
MGGRKGRDGGVWKMPGSRAQVVDDGKSNETASGDRLEDVAVESSPTRVSNRLEDRVVSQ